MPRFSAIRAGIVLTVVAVLLLGMSARVAYLQTYGRHKIVRSAERQTHTNRPIAARRGSMFDRNGLLMAGTVQTLSVYMDPTFLLQQYQRDGRNLNQMDEDLCKLARTLEMSADELTKLVGERFEARYLRIADNKDEAVAREVQKLNIPGVGVEPVPARSYPMGSLAAHVLGTVGREGQGLEGMELRFQSLLAGKNGFKRIEKDARKRPIGVDAEDYIPPAHGQHLVLTIDANIQMVAEEELAEACRKFKASRGEVVVMDPNTGEVLALANWPTFNPQNLGDSTAEMRRNTTLVVPYEPGSILKPFVMGPGLAGKFTRETEVWPIHGITYVAPYGRRVTDVHHYGPLSSWDVLVKSSNIGMSMLAARMGNPNLHKALSSFGFGKCTGIELPGEDGGVVNPLKKWTRYSTESVAQGYEMMVTPIQLARAFCVFGNGGKLVQPRLIKGTIDGEGNLIEKRPAKKFEELPQVLNEETVKLMRQIMADVVVRGTGTKARSKVWNLFGKTGTAHVSMGKRGYSPNLYNSSFLAGAPLEEPRVIVAMTIHEADRRLGHYGGTVTAPAAGKILERVLGYLQVPASPPLMPPPQAVINVMHNYNPKAYASETASAR